MQQQQKKKTANTKCVGHSCETTQWNDTKTIVGQTSTN